MNTFSSYIRSNAGYYNQIAEDFYSSTAAAHTKAEYRAAFASVCRSHMREFTNPEVMRYMETTGAIEPEDVANIKRFYIENAEHFQREVLSAELQEGKRYTLVYLNEFGFPVADNITLSSVYPCQYAQYTDAVAFRFKRKKARTETVHYFYDCSLAVFEGWHTLEKEDTFEKVRETASATMYKSKYSSFDARYFIELVQKLGSPILQYSCFKIGVDGKIYA